LVSALERASYEEAKEKGKMYGGGKRAEIKKITIR
jgi:hypothetical protein